MRVGKWRVDNDVWDVTPETLRRISNSFQQAKQNGVDCPLVWNHSTDAKDRIGSVTNLTADGDVLFAEVEIPNEEDARRALLSPVSVGHADKWIDGQFRTYEDHLVHLGVVQHPVVPGQGPFKELSLVSESKAMRHALSVVNGKIKLRLLAEGDQPSGSESVVEDIAAGNVTTATDATSEDLAPLFRELFDLIGIPGLQLSKNATDETLLAEVKLLLGVAKGMKGETEVPAEPESAPPDVIEQATPGAMNYASLLKFATGLQNRLLSIYKSETDAKKNAFLAEIDRLCKAGILTATDRTRFLSVGDRSGYDVELLSPIKTLSANIPTTSKTRNLATSNEPDLGGQKTFSQLSADERKAKVKSFVGK